MAKPAPRSTAERISSVALRLLENRGPEAVSMRAVAEAVGITPMAIYHHFPSREALLQAVTDREFDRLGGFMAARRAKLGPNAEPEKVLLASMHGYVDYAMQHPLLFDYVFSKDRPGARRFPEDFRAERSPTMNPVAQTIAAAMDAGSLRKDDVWEVAMQVLGLTHGFVVLYRGGRFSFTEKEFRAFCERAMERLFAGLRENP